jgi:hypothetical protein
MASDIEAPLGRLRDIEEELERTLDARRAEFRYRLERNKVIFEQEVIARHRRIRTGLLRFLRDSSFGALITAPAVYALIVPLALLDLTIALYQAVCFPIWGMARVRRADYVVIDRHHLAYLNGIEKLNCVYCGYANGLIALAREVASRTEQYWCPIKHAIRVRGAHPRQRQFVDYGDADAFRNRLEALREEIGNM